MTPTQFAIMFLMFSIPATLLLAVVWHQDKESDLNVWHFVPARHNIALTIAVTVMAVFVLSYLQ